MSDKFVITITLESDDFDRTAPEINIKTDASNVKSGHFALLSKTIKDLIIAPLETQLQVSVDLAESATRASDAGAFDDDE